MQRYADCHDSLTRVPRLARASTRARSGVSCRDTGTILHAPADLVGHTPMVYYKHSERLFGKIACKLEFFNGSKSVKDRIAYAMIEDAEKKGKISPGETTLIEPTSGNTGIALAYAAAAKGYKLVLTMPESMSVERRLVLRGYGAKIRLTPRELGMRGALDAAETLSAKIPSSWCLGQFENPANPAVHYSTTGPEIWEDTAGQVGYLVAGVGTGGTIAGAGRFLKEKNPGVRVVAVEPRESPVLRGGKAGAHGIAGIGAGFVPAVLDMDLIDDVVLVSTKNAEAHARRAALTQGLLVGISSGAALAAAIKIAKRPEARNKLIVAVLASSGERYLSTPMYEDLWTSSTKPYAIYNKKPAS